MRTAAANRWPGVVGLTTTSYRHFASLAGEWLLEERPIPVQLGSPSAAEQHGERKAIYIVVNTDGTCCYVGQTRPRERFFNAAAARLRQHLAEESKRAQWAAYWVIPLLDNTPRHIVDLMERRIASRLLVPLRHTRRDRTAPPAPSRNVR